MSPVVTPLFIADVSAFTKALRKSLQQAEQLPGHASLLGQVAKAAGYRNFQHLKASQPERSQPLPANPQLDKALRVFDDAGVMTRWPAQTAVQGLCLWLFWSRLPAGRDLSEKEVNAVLIAGSSFGDHVLLRRSLIDHGLVSRSRDGAVYRRIEQRPPQAALALLAALSG